MYEVKITKKDDSIFGVYSQGAEFTIDKRGKEGVFPLSGFLAGLGSCVAVYVGRYLKGKRVDDKGFVVTAKAELYLEPPVRFKDIDIEIDLKGAELEKKDKERLLNFIKNCPAHKTLETPPCIKTNLVG